MRALRTAFKIAPKTKDEEYEDRKKALEELRDSMNVYGAAIDRVKSSVRSAAESLVKVRSAFDKLSTLEGVDRGTQSTVASFGNSVDRITGEYLNDFKASMDGEVGNAVLNMKKLCDECDVYRHNRDKALRDYDVCRDEIVRRESEYVKKNKSLAESRTYNANIVKREDLREQAQRHDGKFKDCHDFVLKHTPGLINSCMATFCTCLSLFTGRITDELASTLNRACRSEKGTPDTFQNGETPSASSDSEENSHADTDKEESGPEYDYYDCYS